MSGSFNNNLITGGDTKQDMVRFTSKLLVLS